MFILSGQNERLLLSDLNQSGGLKINNYRIMNGIGNNGVTLVRDEDPEVLQARLLDIAAALESGKVLVYDVNKEVGYWKPKSTPKKAAPKAPAKPAEGK